MYTPINQIIDFVTHFIGELRLPLEDPRMRGEQEEGPAANPEIDPLQLELSQSPELQVKDIGVGRVGHGHYTLPEDEIEFEQDVELDIHVPLIHTDAWVPPQAPVSVESFSIGGSTTTQFLIPPPADFAAVIQQHGYIFDQDIIVVGNPDFAIPLPDQPVVQLKMLEMEAREALDGFSSLKIEFSHTQLAELVTSTHQMVENAEAPTVAGPTLSGQWVNGAPVVGEAPDLDDVLPDHLSLEKIKNGQDKDGAEGPKAQSDSLTIDASKTDTTMDVTSGGNLAINEAMIVDAGYVATTIAVAGDYYCIDVIVQSNVISTSSEWVSALPSGMECSISDDVLVNLAEFAKVTHDKAGDAAEAKPGQFPNSWGVTIVDSDLITFNWLYQYNFIADGDSLVMTATGTTTSIASGGNIAMNATGITYMGNSYDLMLIGGNLYDMNYISQLNILYDHDLFGAHGDLPGNSGTVNSGGNVLWNEAAIARVGATDWQQGVPSQYSQTMAQLDQGNAAMPKGLMGDSNFEGLSNLKVLYITGNVFGINYVEQVNVMGDPDKVLLYAEETFKKNVEWDVHTGGNVLVNAAKILDYQSMGDTAYLGGNQYSQAMLIQSEIIKTGSENPSQFVTEALAFLAEDFDGDTDNPSDTLGLAALAGHGADGLDAILA